MARKNRKPQKWIWSNITFPSDSSHKSEMKQAALPVPQIAQWEVHKIVRYISCGQTECVERIENTSNKHGSFDLDQKIPWVCFVNKQILSAQAWH